jgi:hypothetical protein
MELPIWVVEVVLFHAVVVHLLEMVLVLMVQVVAVIPMVMVTMERLL